MTHESEGDRLAEAVGEVLSDCLAKGMVLPFITICASPNGSVTALRYKADDAGEALAIDPLPDHAERGGFELPVSIVIPDQSGEAVRVSIEQDRVTYP
jgi:hypothetical protein